jgi:hypothetical protein
VVHPQRPAQERARKILCNNHRQTLSGPGPSVKWDLLQDHKAWVLGETQDSAGEDAVRILNMEIQRQSALEGGTTGNRLIMQGVAVHVANDAAERVATSVPFPSGRITISPIV